MAKLKNKKIVSSIIAMTMMILLAGCRETTTSNNTGESTIEEQNLLTEKESEYVIETEQIEDKNFTEMDEVQKNSVEMLNYLTVLAEEVHQSANSKLFLENVTDSLLNDLYPNAIDKRTQNYISNMLQNIDLLRMVDVKRERLAFLYEQNKAMAMKSAIPSPLSLLNVVESANPLQMLASVTYLAIDA